MNFQEQISTQFAINWISRTPCPDESRKSILYFARLDQDDNGASVEVCGPKSPDMGPRKRRGSARSVLAIKPNAPWPCGARDRGPWPGPVTGTRDRGPLTSRTSADQSACTSRIKACPRKVSIGLAVRISRRSLRDHAWLTSRSARSYTHLQQKRNMSINTGDHQSLPWTFRAAVNESRDMRTLRQLSLL